TLSFFFSSRRRHTRFSRDWSSDVCSSDLVLLAASGDIGPNDPVPMEYVGQAIKWVTMHEVGHTLGLRHNFRSSFDTPLEKLTDQIGRASCRERGYISVVGGSL